MGMPISIEIVDANLSEESFTAAFEYLSEIDTRFSTYKFDSEISRINRGEIKESNWSEPVKVVFALAEKARRETEGYFDIHQPNRTIDPSGVVKGWAIKNTAALLAQRGHQNFMVEAAGDIAVSGMNAGGGEWSIGIRNPFNREEIVKVVYPKGKGIATSGSYVRGAHIYNPHDAGDALDTVVSVTVIGGDVLESDILATAAFAMGEKGIDFLERTDGFEGYSITKDGIATQTSGFSAYTTI